MESIDLHRKEERSGGDNIVSSTVVDEEILLRRIFEESPTQGCEVLFQKYYKLLCSHAVRFVYSREVAEDIVSEIFCNFWRDEVYTTITVSYRAYLFKAVRFRAYNYIRWELSKKNKEVDYETLADQLNSLRPEDTLQLDELADEISRIIENLPPQRKKVFVASRFENKKYREIAEDMGISVKAVEAHVSKALETLRATLKSSELLSVMLLAYFIGL